MFARRAVDLLVSRIVTETLTTPRRHILLLLECLLYRAASPRDLDFEPLEETLVRPVRVTSAPVALLRPSVLRAASPLVVGAVTLPTETGVWGVVESRHLEGAPQS